MPGHLPHKIKQLSLLWDGKKCSSIHFSISFKGLVECIKSKAKCQKVYWFSIQWPLKRSLMKMSDFIYSSSSWPWETFHLVNNVKMQRHELHKTIFNGSEPMFMTKCQGGLQSCFSSRGWKPRSGPSGGAFRSALLCEATHSISYMTATWLTAFMNNRS